MSHRLEAKVAIVTGASGGIGRAVALLFASEGARLVLAGRRPHLEWLPAGCQYLAGDVTDEEYAKKLAKTAMDRFGQLDILVNAHGLDFHSDLADTSLEEARRIIDVNLNGALTTIKHAVPALAAGRGGAIVNVASRLGKVAIPGQAVYSASKGGLIMLSKGAAIDLAKKGVRVNVVAPGITNTAMIEQWVASQPDPSGFRRSLENSIPLARLARPEEVAAAILFLASDEAAYITGAVLPVDGGYTAM